MDRLLMENDASVIKSLKADLKAAQAENARLRSELYAFNEAVKPTFAIINRPAVIANLQGEQQSAFWMLKDALERVANFLKALQPTPEVSHE